MGGLGKICGPTGLYHSCPAFAQLLWGHGNVESVFSAVKRKFGDSVRSRTDVAMTNEVLAKFLCHNIVVNIHEQEELGIEPVFWPSEDRDVIRLPAR